MKNSNMCEFPIPRDILLITDAEYGVDKSVPKLLMECSVTQLHNELIASTDDVGLLGSRQANTKYVIISDTILRSLAPPQLLPMKDYHKMMCDCAIYKNSKYFQE